MYADMAHPGESPFQETTEQDLIKKVLRAWEYRWIALWITIAICIAGWTIVEFIPNKYEAKARIYIDSQSILGPLLKGIAIDNEARQIEVAETTRKTLLRRPNLEKIARETDKDLEARTPQEFEQVLISLADAIHITGGKMDNIFLITYEDKDPAVAKKVVDSLLSLFVEGTLRSMHQDTGRTEDFLDEQISEYRSRLEAAENELKEFKRKHIGVMPTEAGGYFVRLQQAIGDLEKASLDLREAQKKRDSLRAELAEWESRHREAQPVPSADPEAGRRRELLVQRLSRLQSDYDRARLKYTDSHPDVVAIRQSIDELEREIARHDEAHPPAKPASGEAAGLPSLDPSGKAYQELKVEVSNAEAEVSALQVRVEEFRRRVDELKQKMATIPDVEAKLARLNRDYEINKRNYEALVARRESVSITQSAEQNTNTVQIRIIDPPVVPIIPSRPNRPLLLTAVLGLGFGLGVWVAWLKASFRRIVETTEDVEAVVEDPKLVLGSVPQVPILFRAHKTYAYNIIFSFLFVGLLVAYGLLVTKEVLHLNSVFDLTRFLNG